MKRKLTHAMSAVRLAGVFLIALLMALCSSCEGFFVYPTVSSITLTPATPSLVKGNSVKFTAVATYSDGTTGVLGSCTWSTSNAAVVHVDNTGTATGISSGSATISANYEAGTGSTTVSVVDSPLTRLEIAPINPSISLSGTNTQQFSATAIFADGSSKDVTSSVTWSSSKTNIATISSTGLATAAAVGISEIRAVSGSVNVSTTLTVLQ